MVSREEVMDSVDSVMKARRDYEGALRESAVSADRRWDTLHQTPSDEQRAALTAASAQVSSNRAASLEAFETFGRALVEMHSLELGVRK